MRIVVPDDYGGERLDRTLGRLGGVSRAAARRLIEGGGVAVDGIVVDTLRRPVTPGEVIEFEPAVTEELLAPVPVDFAVVYEDAHLAVIDKPTGVVVHPGAGDPGPTLAAGILHRWPEVRGVGDEGRWGIVHRLDRETSGLMVVALTAASHAGLRQMVRRREVTREYLALVRGTPPAPSGTVDAPLDRDRRRPTRRRVAFGGRPARTHYRVEEALGDWTLLRLTLETGRTHQIRVHLASIGLPVAGDRVYGIATGSPRMFLHAQRLAFDHPVGGDRIDVASPLPPDLAEAVLTARSGPGTTG